LVVLPAAEVSVPKPNAASICCPRAVPSKKHDVKRMAINASFLKFFSEIF
jgi:hypothetical protein